MKVVRIIRVILGIALVLFGALLILGNMMGEPVGALYVISVCCFFLAYLLIRKKSLFPKKDPAEPSVPAPAVSVEAVVEPVAEEEPAVSTSEAVEPAPAAEPESGERYSFKVAGISNYEQNIIDNLLDETCEYQLSKKEVLEDCLDNQRIYRYEGFSTDVKFVPEPDNPYDKNAIQVFVDDVLIGYVPAKKTRKDTQLLESAENLIIGCVFYGGPYKILFEDDYGEGYKFKRYDDNNIGAEITMKYSK